VLIIYNEVMSFVYNTFPMRRQIETYLYEQLRDLALMNIVDIGEFQKKDIVILVDYMCGEWICKNLRTFIF